MCSDTVCDLGGARELANYGEYSGAPSESQTYEYAKTIIKLMTEGPPRPDGKIFFLSFFPQFPSWGYSGSCFKVSLSNYCHPWINNIFKESGKEGGGGGGEYFRSLHFDSKHQHEMFHISLGEKKEKK